MKFKNYNTYLSIEEKKGYDGEYLFIHMSNQDTHDIITMDIKTNSFLDAVGDIERFEESWTGRVYHLYGDPSLGTVTILNEPDSHGYVAHLTEWKGDSITGVANLQELVVHLEADGFEWVE